MNKVINHINKNYNGEILGVDFNDATFGVVVKSLDRNGTFMPNIKNVIFNGTFTRVFFADGTSVSVKCSKEDQNSKDAAIAFAVMKRAYGRPEGPNGEIVAHGFSNFLKEIREERSFDQVAFAEEREARRQARKEAYAKRMSEESYPESDELASKGSHLKCHLSEPSRVLKNKNDILKIINDLSEKVEGLMRSNKDPNPMVGHKVSDVL